MYIEQLLYYLFGCVREWCEIQAECGAGFKSALGGEVEKTLRKQEDHFCCFCLTSSECPWFSISY